MRTPRLAVALLIAASAVISRGDEWSDRFDAIAENRVSMSEAARLHMFFDTAWDWGMAHFPEFATSQRHPRARAGWTDMSIEAIASRKLQGPMRLKVLATIDRSALGPVDQVSYDLFKRLTHDGIDGDRFPEELLPVSQRKGIQQRAASFLAQLPARSVADYELLVEEIRLLPARVDQEVALMREGVSRGVTNPKITLRDVAAQIASQIPEDALESPLLRPFKEMPDSIGADDAARLRVAAAEAFEGGVRQAFAKMHEAFVDEYLPAARESVAQSELPDGEAWYAWLVREQTSTDLTPREIHELGLREVARIRAEMEKVKTAAGFEGTMQEFFTFLRTDPRFYFTKKEDLLAATRDIMKRADPELMALFGKLPRATYGVIPIPEYSEKSQTTAYYQRSSVKGGRPGYYFVNTYALNTRPKWEMEALSLHEAVPGHHLQISLAQEIEGLPEFRRMGGYTAFTEGWGLYSESLGEEMGFYKDPYSKFGQLTYQMWRAVRLVVDTGLHAFGWSRQQAIDYFKENAPKTENDITVEIDRYIVMPGQALAYKLGELKLKELRAYATAELGAKFDIRAFHDEVLRHGAVSLDVLETQVKAWVAAQKIAKGR
jgi:uncharacterized protein (DUF885 family)